MTTILATHDLAEAITLADEVMVLSGRPASIAAGHSVPFGRDRDVSALRETPEFLDLYGRVWRDLSDSIARTRRDAADG
jgi:ABC-type nitrate/sulfonate/bicarbonate transport system ATPase subunit